jgi:1-acyl-sn-glycerol-3-phosphate acyltransferase
MRAFWFISNLVFSIFIFSILIIIVGFFDRKKEYTGILSKIWANWVLWSSGIKYIIYGLDNLDLNKQYIFISNHVSALDIILGFVAIPLNITFLAKKELFRIPFFGWAMSAAGMIKIDRQNSDRAKASIDKAVNSLIDSTFSTIIYPEGTRSVSGDLLPFKKGGFVLAIRSQIPIVPLTIVGAGKALPKGSLSIKKKEIKLFLGKPIKTIGIDLKQKDDLLQNCRQEITNNLNKINKS